MADETKKDDEPKIDWKKFTYEVGDLDVMDDSETDGKLLIDPKDLVPDAGSR